MSRSDRWRDYHCGVPTTSLSSWTFRPRPGLVRWFALAVLVSQVLISITGSVVRVTGSGLGCPTWPQCFPGSMVPVAHPEVDAINQVIEFGNRVLGLVVGLVAIGAFVVAYRARPYRPRLVRMAAALPVGVLAQGVIGGITVWLNLEWWSVAIHFLASTVLICLATFLFVAASEGDRPATWVITGRMRKLLVALGIVGAATLVAGTLVTAAGPHAGDAETARLDLPITALARVHGTLVTAYVCLLAVFGAWLRSARPTKMLLRAYVGACAVVLAQGAIGYVQYLLAVPAAMVVLHVVGAGLVTVSFTLLWGASRYRGPIVTTPSKAADTVGV